MCLSVLRQKAHAAGNGLVRVGKVDAPAIQAHCPTRMAVEAKQGPRYLRAARTDYSAQSENLTDVDGEGHAIDAVVGRQILHFQTGDRLDGADLGVVVRDVRA